MLCLIATNLYAAGQAGAEATKQPTSARIIPPSGSKADGSEVGNVRVTYTDGTKDLWTTKGNCSLPQVSQNGTVGWTVNGPERKVNASYTMRPNDTLVLCWKGKVIAQIKSAKAFIEKWDFIERGKLVLLTRASHGPADIELHDAATGKLIDSVKAYSDNLPEWAKPYKDN